MNINKINVRGKNLYCILFYNKIEIGRTEAVEVDYVLRAKVINKEEEAGTDAKEDGDEDEEEGEEGDDENESRDIKNTYNNEDGATSLPPLASGRSGRGAAFLEKVVDVFYGAEDIRSMVYFERFPPEKPQREGNLLEVELVTDVPRRKNNMMMSMGGLNAKAPPVVARISDRKSRRGEENKLDEDMELVTVGLGCATFQGLDLDNWLNSKTPLSRILEVLPSTRFPLELGGGVVKRMSMLSQLSGGIVAPPQVLGSLKLTTPGINVKSPYQLQSYHAEQDKLKREAVEREAEKVAQRAAAKEAKKKEKAEKKKLLEQKMGI